MTIQKITMYRCNECNKLYYNHPELCTCSNHNYSGKIVGPFRLRYHKGGRKWEVECLFCGEIKDLCSSNLKRQKSCGCIPRHIHVLELSESEMTADYQCQKCFKITNEELPILEWCCE